ncbi:hypothetical protein I3760_15G095200 [Carya illinoinensis]|nr:hypothetical protein I3760_15G095200 [Carya illinoinensis]
MALTQPANIFFFFFFIFSTDQLRYHNPVFIQLKTEHLLTTQLLDRSRKTTDSNFQPIALHHHRRLHCMSLSQTSLSWSPAAPWQPPPRWIGSTLAPHPEAKPTTIIKPNNPAFRHPRPRQQPVSTTMPTFKLPCFNLMKTETVQHLPSTTPAQRKPP